MNNHSGLLENLDFHRLGERIDATGLKQPWFTVLPNDSASDHFDAEVLNNQHDLHYPSDVGMEQLAGSLGSLEDTA